MSKSAVQTAILLPSARVTLFTRRGDTGDVFRALAKDWRFARVTLEVVEGDVETAIALYASKTSPDLVIIETEETEGDFSGRLEALSGRCAEGTAAIVVGPVNDVNLYRRLVGMGVSDYLVRPLHVDSLSQDIAATLISRIGSGGSRLIAVLGAKGGVGTTALSQALAWGVAERMAQKTFLLDAAGGWSTLSVGMNFEPSTTLNEAVRAAAEKNEDSLTRMVFKAADKLSVLSVGMDTMLDDLVYPEAYEALLDHLMATHPVLIADLSSSPAGLRRTVLSRAHGILLVTTPALAAVRATRTLMGEIRTLRGNEDEALEVIVNMVGIASGVEVEKAQIEEGIERKISCLVPFDSNLFLRTENDARKLTVSKGGEEIVDRLLPLLHRALGAVEQPLEIRQENGMRGILSRLRGRG